MPLTEQQIRDKIDDHIGNELNPKIRGAIHNEILQDIMDFLASVAGNYALTNLVFDADRSHNAGSYRDTISNLRQYVRSVSHDPGINQPSFREKGFGNTSQQIIKEWLNGDDEQALLLNSIGDLFFKRIAAMGITPTAYVHLPSSDGSAGSGPIKIEPGTLLSTPEDGLIESDANHLYKTHNGERKRLLTFDESISMQTANSPEYTIDFGISRVIKLNILQDCLLSFSNAKKTPYNLIVDNTGDYAVTLKQNALWKSNLRVQPNFTGEIDMITLFDGTFMHVSAALENQQEI